MNFYNIKKISYSTEHGNIVTEKLINMEHSHVSSGWNAYKKFNII